MLPPLVLCSIGVAMLVASYVSEFEEKMAVVRTSGAILALAALSLPVITANRKWAFALPAALFLAGLGHWVFIEVAIGKQLYSPPAVVEDSIAQTILFGAMLLAGILILGVVTNSRLAAPTEQTSSPKELALLVPWWVPALAAAPELLRRLAHHGWNVAQLFSEMLLSRAGDASWRFNKNLGDESAIFLPLTFLLACVPALAVAALTAKSNRTVPKALFICLPLLFVVTDLILAGNRFNFLKPVLATGLFIMLHPQIGKLLRIKLAAAMVACGAVIMLLQGQVRGFGWASGDEANVLRQLIESDPDLRYANYPDRVGLNIGFEYQMARVFSDLEPPRLGTTLLWYLVNPIPRFIWPDKPIIWAHEYSMWRGLDPISIADDGSGSPTGLATLSYAEMYANFRIAGVVGLFMFGMATALVVGIWILRPRSDVDLIQWCHLIVPAMFVTRGFLDMQSFMYHSAMLFLVVQVIKATNRQLGATNPLASRPSTRVTTHVEAS